MVIFMQPIDHVQADKTAPPPAPPPPPTRTLNRRGATWSFTRQEIDKFWRRKQMEEEDHLLAAIKAAARIRARNFSEENYRKFEESLSEATRVKVGDDHGANDYGASTDGIRVGIKDWWTKSMYAYLNQPAATEDSTDKRRMASAWSSYTPSILYFCNPTPSSSHFPSSVGAV